jgi:hypothetical protein
MVILTKKEELKLKAIQRIMDSKVDISRVAAEHLFRQLLFYSPKKATVVD